MSKEGGYDPINQYVVVSNGSKKQLSVRLFDSIEAADRHSGSSRIEPIPIRRSPEEILFPLIVAVLEEVRHGKVAHADLVVDAALQAIRSGTLQKAYLALRKHLLYEDQSVIRSDLLDDLIRLLKSKTSLRKR